MTERKALTELYHEWAANSVDEKGFEISHGLVLGQDDKLTVVALAVPPMEAYAAMLAMWAKQPREMIFALDRFAKPGQGTVLADLLAGHHFTAAGPRPFIIEYQHRPLIMRPIDWHNAWWNFALLRELAAAAAGNLVSASAETAAPITGVTVN